VDAQIGIARTQLADQKFAEALRQLAPLSKSQPRNADVFTLLAKAYSGLGRKLEARQAESRANVLLGEAKKTGDDKN
jgi:predicted Zn-dependent protease